MDIDHLNEVISASGKTIKSIALKMGLSRQSLYLKMNGKREFKASEVYKLCEILRLTNEEKERIFFTNEVDKNDNRVILPRSAEK